MKMKELRRTFVWVAAVAFIAFAQADLLECQEKTQVASDVNNVIAVSIDGTVYFADGERTVWFVDSTAESPKAEPFVGVFGEEGAYSIGGESEAVTTAREIQRNRIKMDAPSFVSITAGWPRTESKMLVVDSANVFEISPETDTVRAIGLVSRGFKDMLRAINILDFGQTKRVAFLTWSSNIIWSLPYSSTNREMEILSNWSSSAEPFVGSRYKVAYTGEDGALGKLRTEAQLHEIVWFDSHPTNGLFYFAEKLSSGARILFVDVNDRISLLADGFRSIDQISFCEDGTTMYVTDSVNATVIAVDVPESPLTESLRIKSPVKIDGQQDPSVPSLVPPSVPLQALFVTFKPSSPGNTGNGGSTFLRTRLGSLVLRSNDSKVETCALWKSTSTAPPPTGDVQETTGRPTPGPVTSPTTPGGGTTDPSSGDNTGNPATGKDSMEENFALVAGAAAGSVAIAALLMVAAIQKRRQLAQQTMFELPISPKGQSRKEQEGGMWAEYVPKTSQKRPSTQTVDTVDSNSDDDSVYDIPIAFAIPVRKDRL